MGRAIMLDNSKEAELWEILGPLELWPRWYLFAFATLYREENIAEYNRVKANRWNRKRAAARRSGILEQTKEAARRSLHPTLRPVKMQGPPDSVTDRI